MPGMLFGLNVSTEAQAGTDPVAAASKAEELGFDFVSASDHQHGGRPTFEPWTLLSWIAAATSRIRVATRVLAVPYRHPTVLAKMAETLDRLSGGRLILGLGGGAVDEEFRAFGLGVRSPRDKVDGLAEAIRILRGVWSQPSFSFQGRLYRTDGAELQPKREHPIPIWLGTYGRRPADVSERLGSFVELGFTAMNFILVGPGQDEQLERLAREVLPVLRATDAPRGRTALVDGLFDRLQVGLGLLGRGRGGAVEGGGQGPGESAG